MCVCVSSVTCIADAILLFPSNVLDPMKSMHRERHTQMKCRDSFTWKPDTQPNEAAPPINENPDETFIVFFLKKKKKLVCENKKATTFHFPYIERKADKRSPPKKYLKEIPGGTLDSFFLLSFLFCV